MTWTKAREERLAELVASGRSAAQIAVELGITRNSVIGKAARSGMQWPTRPMPIRVMPDAQAAWIADMPRFIELLDAGASPRAIAAELGRPVDQVRDKAARHGLKFRHRGGPIGYGVPKADRPRSPPMPIAAPLPAADGRPVHFLARRPGCCVWPLWKPPARIGLVCGAATVQPSEPYCVEHRAIAWTGTASRAGRPRMREAAE